MLLDLEPDLFAGDETGLALLDVPDAFGLRRFDAPLAAGVREAKLLTQTPWVRTVGALGLTVQTEGWKFPSPPPELDRPPTRVAKGEERTAVAPPLPDPDAPPADPLALPKARIRTKPTADTVLVKDRLLYLLQPPLDGLFDGRQLEVPFEPFPYQLEGIAFLMPRHSALLADEMGLGKAQPLDARVMTPTGWKRMGEIQVGDPVINSQGGVSRVTGVFPQGVKEVFRVEFSDGSSTECCDDHLWDVNTPLRTWRGNPSRVLPLKEIRKQLTQASGNRLHFIPMVEAVEFPATEIPVEPYLLGLLLGDGCLAGHRVRYSSMDDELLAAVAAALPAGLRLQRDGDEKCDYRLVGDHAGKPNPLIRQLKALDLSGTYSESKFIPDGYKFAPVAVRVAVLQGLLDTDGHVRPDNNIEYCTVSERLAEDVQFVVQSLGGTARIRTKRTTGQLAYRMSVILPPDIVPFRLSRKATLYHPRTKYPPCRAITAVTSAGEKPCQCIAVDAPDHLYVTDHFVLTHNTAQAILSLRLLFHQGLIRSGLIVCPKPLVHNWCRELKLWAPDLPYEVFPSEAELRRTVWTVSNCPLKIINYEALTRDADLAADPKVYFDAVVIDEAQRIKNCDSKTARAVRGLNRARSWALTGTPIENHADDLINIFAFVDPGRVPADTPPKRLAQLTSDCILRRTKDDVLTADGMPPKIMRDLSVDLTPAQAEAYELAEKEGVVHLNELGETITVQHVFQLVMRLKQICNFDPRTGESAKLEQLLTDMEEVAENGRKAIIFSQWVEPLQVLATALDRFGPLQYHGRIPQKDRTPILDQFQADPTKHVLLMSYGSGSVGLNLQFSNYVFLFDRWWNPAVEDQAINRAHRIGQKYPVTVTRFLSEGTIEARIAIILDAKRKVFNDLLAQADKPANLGLTEDDVFGLFDIQARPKRVG